MNSDKEIKKYINPISITIIILTIAIGYILFYFHITHWSFTVIGGVPLLIFAASIRIADQWEKAVVLHRSNRPKRYYWQT